MRFSTLIYATISWASDSQIRIGKTILQKIIFLAFPDSLRKNYYKPYYYGPFSRNVQSVAESLTSLGLLIYEDNTFSRDSRINPAEFDDEEDLFQRIKSCVSFLSKHDLRFTREIAILSKTVLLLSSYTDKDNPDTVSFLREKATFYDWQDFLELPDGGVKKYIKLATDFESEINATEAKKN